MTIYTIGHSTRPIDQFVELLQAYNINLLVDVRSIPKSRHTPQFNADNLAATLWPAGVDYCHLSSLGGLRHTSKDSINQGWHNASFRGYADYMQTEEFANGIDALICLASGHSASCSDAVQGSKEKRKSRIDNTATEQSTPADAAMRRELAGRQAAPDDRTAARRVAIMCAEAVPWRCHRSMIGDSLIARGYQVMDIFDKHKSVAEKLTSFAKLDHQSVTYPTEQ